MKTKGCKSVVNVSLADLNRLFQPDALIPVSVKFARAVLSQQGVPFKAAAEDDDFEIPADAPAQIASVQETDL